MVPQHALFFPFSELSFKLSFFLPEMLLCPSVISPTHFSGPSWNILPSRFFDGPLLLSYELSIITHISELPKQSTWLHLNVLALPNSQVVFRTFPRLLIPSNSSVTAVSMYWLLTGWQDRSITLHVWTLWATPPTNDWPFYTQLTKYLNTLSHTTISGSLKAGDTPLPFHRAWHTDFTCLTFSNAAKMNFKRKAIHFTIRYVIKATFT